MLTFKTKAEVVSYLNNHPRLDSNLTNTVWFCAGSYLCDHGEYEKPDYVPRRYKDGWGVKKIYYFYSGTLYAPEDHRVLEMDI